MGDSYPEGWLADREASLGLQPAAEQPDVMNDPTFAPQPPNRRDTISSKAASEGGSERADTCRICRSEGTPKEPLFYPCKCSGSIKFVHQECLMEWLSHSHKKHCELCKTPFRFTKLYDANMPERLPWVVFVQRACWHVVLMVGRAGRGVLVGAVWLGIIPWIIRWVWRWFFWIADAAWAREAFMNMMQNSARQQQQRQVSSGDWISHTFQQFFEPQPDYNETNGPLAYNLANAIAKNLGLAGETTTHANSSFTWPQADPSILSSWSYLASMTPNPYINRLILDVFEGQLITCVVITGFILVFLIREWVVQQQPLVNVENLNNVQNQLREAVDRVQQDHERLQHQQELLEHARANLEELQNDTERFLANTSKFNDAGKIQFRGWEALEGLIDHANGHLKKEGAIQRAHFLSCAAVVTKQIRAANSAGVNMEELVQKVFQKLASYPDEERKEWAAVLQSEIEKERQRRQELESEPLIEGMASSSDNTRRPLMPGRDFQSRATEIQRLLSEAEETLRDTQRSGADDLAVPRTTAELRSETASIVSLPSTESWQQITPPTGSPADHSYRSMPELEILPITNAGPDAKVNIRRSGKGKWRAVPEPKIDEKMVTNEELKKKLEEEVAEEIEEEKKTTAPTGNESQGVAEPSRDYSDNPFHPDGPNPPERRNSESFGNRVASVFREEFGLDEAEQLEGMRQSGIRPDGEDEPNDNELDTSVARRAENRPPTFFERMADWFWGDIEARVQETVPESGEEREQVGDEAPQAPFAPVQDDQPAAGNARAIPAIEADQPHHDPEVLAAAQQAGLDAEAIEDAEDLEGVFELIGLQGPLIGLFQTSAFCTLLVGCTILSAVILPYVGGKLVLSFLGSPVYFLVKLPLQIASFVADFVIDITLTISGWMVMMLSLAISFLLSAAQAWMPRLGGVSFAETVANYSNEIAAKAVFRLRDLFVPSEPIKGLSWSWGFLAASVHAHASLRDIIDNINAVLNGTGAAVTWLVETISSGSVLNVCWQSIKTLLCVSNYQEWLTMGFAWIKQDLQPLLDVLYGLSKGALTISTPEIQLDPSLVYWNSADRALAILAGYTALAGLAAIYVTMDTPITKSENGQKTEKIIRDTLRQAGGVLKVILIISIEMLVFPLYCGMLLDLAFLPLFQDASVATRWAFAGRKPYTFCFVHWFIGTCYMFHFALFVGMCRKILRKGVLWFIRDPDDPTFHPVRDVLERNVATQLRKIAFSALVYGALVILCLGGVIWTIGHAVKEIFPIHWVSTEPVIEFPMDLLLYNFVTPLVIRLFKPSDTVNSMYAWWLRRCARMLRLSHFLFDDRRQDEEGHYIHKTWSSLLTMRAANNKEATDADDHQAEDNQHSDVSFRRDGKYVLTPCNDQYRPPKPGEAFLHTDDDDVYIADKDGKRNDHFAKVYVPPWFRVRITLFMVCLWMFSAFIGLCATLVPLMFGRYIFASFTLGTSQINDIYAYSVGAYVLLGAIFVAVKGRAAFLYLRDKAEKVNFRAWIEPMRHFAVRTLKCSYVYGFLGVMVPIFFALLLQFYLILPLHTWTVSAMTNNTSVTDQQSSNNGTANSTTLQFFTNTTNQSQQQMNLPTLAGHTIHILQDYALGLLYVRMASRLIIATPASRAAEAFRRITQDGYLNPNIRLATRFFVLPVTLIAAFLLLFPPLVTNVGLTLTHTFASQESWAANVDTEFETKMYRYSYPLAASGVVLILGVRELGKATSRWRARIRDEVYLVGERLHNFGEKRPPPGSKSVVRKER